MGWSSHELEKLWNVEMFVVWLQWAWSLDQRWWCPSKPRTVPETAQWLQRDEERVESRSTRGLRAEHVVHVAGLTGLTCHAARGVRASSATPERCSRCSRASSGTTAASASSRGALREVSRCTRDVRARQWSASQAPRYIRVEQ